MAKSKNVQISESLFLEICKFFLLGNEYSDSNIIVKGLTAKLEAISARERYAARLLQKRRHNAGVGAPAAANNADDDALTSAEDENVFNAVNNGRLAATEENCGDGCIIL